MKKQHTNDSGFNNDGTLWVRLWDRRSLNKIIKEYEDWGHYFINENKIYIDETKKKSFTILNFEYNFIEE